MYGTCNHPNPVRIAMPSHIHCSQFRYIKVRGVMQLGADFNRSPMAHFFTRPNPRTKKKVGWEDRFSCCASLGLGRSPNGLWDSCPRARKKMHVFFQNGFWAKAKEQFRQRFGLAAGPLIRPPGADQNQGGADQNQGGADQNQGALNKILFSMPAFFDQPCFLW